MGKFVEEKKIGVPAYMVSFGDMMTNLLTFFILLCALSTTQDASLLAQGIGSFVAAIESRGRPALLSETENLAILNNIRRRFNLPPETDTDRRTDHFDASEFELLRAAGLERLIPHDELRQPLIASFSPGSAALPSASRLYLDRIAETLRPGRRQVLIVEGHATSDEIEGDGRDRRLAFERAAAVRRYLIDTHSFSPERIEARAWLREIESEPNPQGVDARLITPHETH